MLPASPARVARPDLIYPRVAPGVDLVGQAVERGGTGIERVEGGNSKDAYDDRPERDHLLRNDRRQARGVQAKRHRAPRACPRGGFPFAVSVSFQDGERTSARTTVPCPARTPRAGD